MEDEVFQFIKHFRLRFIVLRAPVFPFVKLIKCIVIHTYCDNCLINTDKGECIRYFLPQDVNRYYKLHESKESLNVDFVIYFYKNYDTSITLVSWWKE
jgi:hypothetical protein